jgi:DNA helicase IV
MTTIYESNLLQIENNSHELLIDRIQDLSLTRLVVEKYNSNDELIGEVNPDVSYVENSVEDKTRIRVMFNDNQINQSEKIKIIINILLL